MRYQWATKTSAKSGDWVGLVDSDPADTDGGARWVSQQRARNMSPHSFVAGVIDGRSARCDLAHLGDCRAYLWRPAGQLVAHPPIASPAPTYCPPIADDAGRLVCLTRDHSTACELVESEMITLAEGQRRARRRVVHRRSDERGLPASSVAITLALNDRLLLCSAQVWLAIGNDDIARLLASEDEPRIVVQALVDRVAAIREDTSFAVGVMVWRGSEVSPSAVVAASKDAPMADGSVLAELARDVLADVGEGSRLSVSGREDELRHMVRSLMRRQKPNLLLVGDPGVGKTWLVEALAHFMATPKCPPALRGKRIVALSPAALMAGTRYRGDLEERMQAVLDEAEARDDLIVFVDEIHLLMGAGRSSASPIDIANLLKPALARGRLQLIGATTTAEFRAHIEPDAAFTRRFDVQEIAEPDREAALAIVADVAHSLAQHHGVDIADAAVTAAVDLSTRHLPDRRLPDKAIDILDQACVRACSRWLSLSLSAMSRAPVGEASDERQTVMRDDIVAAVATAAGLPLDVVRLAPEQRLEALGALLGQQVLGQADALEILAAAVARCYALPRPGKVLAAVCFAGPAGVGKRLTCDVLAQSLFPQGAVLHLALDSGRPIDIGGIVHPALQARPARVIAVHGFDSAHDDSRQAIVDLVTQGGVYGPDGSWVSAEDSLVVFCVDDEFGAAGASTIGFRNPVDDTVAASDKISATRRISPVLADCLDAEIAFAPVGQATLVEVAERELQSAMTRLVERAIISAPSRKPLDAILVRVKQADSIGAVCRIVEDCVATWLVSRRA